MENVMKIDIIIVNWNSGAQLRRCLASIDCLGNDNLAKVVVVDNGSVDGSADCLDGYGFSFQVIKNSENLGFARACNQGATEGDARYMLFLNPDTELFSNSLIVPLTFLENAENSGIGICGIQLIDENGHVARTCARFPSLKRFIVQAIGLNKLPGFKGAGVHRDDWDHLTNKSIDHVMGAFFFMRRRVFEVLKGFDDRFFVYLEDLDFSLRARQAGWGTFYLADAQAFHKGGGSSQQVKAKRLFYSLRSRLLYSLKHFPRWQAWVLFGVMAMVEPLSRSMFSLLRGGIADVRNTWSGYGMLYRDLSNIFAEPASFGDLRDQVSRPGGSKA
jgi:GT2 family glycosyltransferase